MQGVSKWVILNLNGWDSKVLFKKKNMQIAYTTFLVRIVLSFLRFQEDMELYIFLKELVIWAGSGPGEEC